MAIPKKIHYCWFGGKELPELAVNCMASWHKYCPDYEIIRWDETNTDLMSCQFVREAYDAEKWAFVSDYMRLKIVEEHGGIYLDVDVELLKTLDPLLVYRGFMGFELASDCVNTGLGFGAEAHNPVVAALMDNYERSPFARCDGSFDMTPCPQRDTKVLVGLGLVLDHVEQDIMGVHIFPPEFFCPISFLGEKHFTEHTVSIHHFNASWLSDVQLKANYYRRLAIKLFGQRVTSELEMFILLYTYISLYGLKKTLVRCYHKFFDYL